MLPISNYATYNDFKIVEGEYPTPAVLNRPALGLLNNDLVLEAAAYALAQQMAFTPSATTKFACHFDKVATDSIGNISPENTIDSNALAPDNIFKGAFFAQDAATNLISANTTIDSSLKSINGWALTGTKVSQITPLFSDNGITFDNEYTLTSEAPHSSIFSSGTIILTSQPYSVQGQDYSSVSVLLDTSANLVYYGISVALTVNFISSSGSIIGTNTKEVTSKYNGILGIEGIATPSGAINAYIVLTISYGHDKTNNIPSVARITLKNVMHNTGIIARTYASKNLDPTYLSYPAVINGTNDFSLFAWVYFDKNQIENYNATYGPLFIVATSGEGSLGIRHLVSDKGKPSFCVSLDENTIGNKVEIPSADLNTYLPVLLRKHIVDNVTVADLLIFTHEHTVLKSTLSNITMTAPTYDILVGKDPISSGYFNGGISELRYDDEWLNDIQFSMRSLSTAVDTTTELAENAVNVNLIQNPTAKFATNLWANVPTAMSAVIDNTYGCSFSWTSSTATTADISSMPVQTQAGDQFTLSGYIKASAITSGSVGLKIAFYSDASGTTSVGAYTAVVNAGFNGRTYLTAVAPANTITVRACMYLLNAKATVVWSRLKLERGNTVSNFSDDSTFAFAYYE